MTKDAFLGIVRHVLTFGSGLAIGQGWVDTSVAAEAVTVLIGVFGVAWSVWQKRQAVA